MSNNEIIKALLWGMRLRLNAILTNLPLLRTSHATKYANNVEEIVRRLEEDLNQLEEMLKVSK
jgi:hypothetical protein